MKSWPEMKSGKVVVGSNIAQNNSSSPNSHETSDQTLGQVGSSSTYLRITHLSNRKSYMFIICLNSYEKLSESAIHPQEAVYKK